MVEKSTGKIVALRAISVGNRDRSLDWQPFELQKEHISEKAKKLANVLEDSKQNFWKIVDPSVNKVLRREMSFVVAGHQRKGIARVMSEFNLDNNQLRVSGRND